MPEILYQTVSSAAVATCLQIFVKYLNNTLINSW